MTEEEMPLGGHIRELRARLIICILSLFGTFLIGLSFARPVLVFLQHDNLPKAITFHIFKVTDAFQIYMDIAFVIGLILALPIVLLQLWLFIKPGLHPREQKMTLRYIPLIFCLFLIGAGFSYLVICPFIITFMFEFSARIAVENTIGLATYLQFLLKMVTAFGFLFQLPVVIMFLTRLHLITPQFLRKVRKYAYFILLILAALISPPELMSHLLITLPLIILYEIGVLISSYTYSKMP